MAQIKVSLYLSHVCDASSECDFYFRNFIFDENYFKTLYLPKITKEKCYIVGRITSDNSIKPVKSNFLTSFDPRSRTENQRCLVASMCVVDLFLFIIKK